MEKDTTITIIIVVALALAVVYYFFASTGFFSLKEGRVVQQGSDNAVSEFDEGVVEEVVIPVDTNTGVINSVDSTGESSGNRDPRIANSVKGAKVLLNGKLIIQDIAVGDGEEVVRGSTVTVNYTGVLAETGKVFDQGTLPDVVVGETGLVEGFTEGLIGMKQGGQRVLVLEPEVAYGDQGVSGPDGTVVIPSNATLIFQIEIISVK